MDDEYREHVVSRVEPQSDDGWALTFEDGWSFYCPKTGVVPEVGDVARLYGRGLGFIVRGLSLNGRPVFYRTPAEQAAKDQDDREAWHQKKRDDFEADRARLDTDYAGLPREFQARIAGFRERRADWRWEHEPYEMSCCVDAVRIAKALGSADAVRQFHALPWAEQQTLVPGLFAGHSGNSFGFACRLAALWMNQPELVAQEHGALCPLVGCEEYGCWATIAGPTP